jgi:ferredoxin
MNITYLPLPHFGSSKVTMAQEIQLDADSPGARIAVTLWDADGCRDVEAYDGESLLVALKRAGLALLAVCGGKGACGTCKVAMRPTWTVKLPEPGKREERLLAHLKSRKGERLSCRISLTAEINGLEVDACN